MTTVKYSFFCAIIKRAREIAGSLKQIMAIASSGDSSGAVQLVANVAKLGGAQIHKLYIDELTQWEFTVFSYLKTRLRTDKKLGVKPMAAYGTNPGGIGNAWVKGRFIDVAPPLTLYTQTVYSELLQEEMKSTRLFIPALVTDNPNVGKEYVFELEQKPAALRDALLYGKWNTFEGQVFWEFADDPDNYRTGKNTHVIAPFEIPAHWTRYRSLDWGYSKPFSVGWWACDEDGVLYRYREWYGCKKNQPDTGLQMTPQEVARQIAQVEKGEGQIIGVADPAIWRSETRECIANMMSKEGIYFSKADNSRLAGKIQLHNRFRFRENQEPMAYIFNTCRDFIRTIPSLVYDERKIEDVDTDGRIISTMKPAICSCSAQSRRSPLRRLNTITGGFNGKL